MIRILIDQGLPATAAALLREGGWDAIHLRDIAMSKAADHEVLDCASRESRVVFTLDRDFPEILALTGATRPSVVLIRHQRMKAREISVLVESICRGNATALAEGCVIKVGLRGIRIRRLPLK